MIVTKEEMKFLEQNSGYSTKELIGFVASNCYEYLKYEISPSDKVIFLCGSGNNGQDGIAIANIFKQNRYNFKIVSLSSKPLNTEHYSLEESDFISQEIFLNTLDEYQILLDCVFGFSFHLPLKEDIKTVFRKINQSQLKVYSMDINSGLQADDGQYDEDTLRSDCTLILGARKPGHLFYKNNLLTKREILITLPIPALENQYEEMDHDRFNELLPKKAENSHKGKNGRLLIYAGSEGLAGACTLAGLTALHSGVSYLHLLIDKAIYPIVGKHILSGVYHFTDTNTPVDYLNAVDAVLTGPGCNHMEDYKAQFKALLSTSSCPVVIDAYGLRILAEDPEILKNTNSKCILTPHLGEFSALTGASISDINANPLKYAKEFVEENDCVLVLKGPNTIVMDKEHTYVNQTGNAKLAKAASGDCLSGIIASFVAQHKTPFEAAMMGVYLHGLCADLTDRSIYTFTPEDIPAMLEKLL